MRSLMRTLVLDGGVAEMHGSETTKKLFFGLTFLGTHHPSCRQNPHICMFGFSSDGCGRSRLRSHTGCRNDGGAICVFVWMGYNLEHQSTIYNDNIPPNPAVVSPLRNAAIGSPVFQSATVAAAETRKIVVINPRSDIITSVSV
jgi:hypothetical protein